MTTLRTYTVAYDPDDIEDGEIPRDDVTEEVHDCTPDCFDIEDGRTAVDLAADFLRDAGLTQASTQPVRTPAECGRLWFSLVDGSQPSGWDGLYTGRMEEVSAHPEGFTPEQVFAIVQAIA